jgi:membrane-bound lytic murein transglycosylase MltF
MKKSYNLTKARFSDDLQSAFKNMDPDGFVDAWKRVPENSKKEKYKGFLYKINKFFSLNKKIYTNGSIICNGEFDFISLKNIH